MTQETFVQDGMTLKAARVNAGLTQKEAANKLGVSVYSLINYEKGTSSPSVNVLKKIEELYGIPYHRIIFL